MNEKQVNTPQIFWITIDGMENVEWQGKIQFADGTEARFISLFDLLHLMQNKLESGLPAGKQEKA